MIKKRKLEDCHSGSLHSEKKKFQISDQKFE